MTKAEFELYGREDVIIIRPTEIDGKYLVSIYGHSQLLSFQQVVATIEMFEDFKVLMKSA